MASLVVECITCRIGGRHVWESATFALDPGVAVIGGPSGSGKTMLLEVLAGLRRADQGRVIWDGNPLRGAVLDEYRAVRGYCPAARWDARAMTVESALQWMAALWEVSKPERAVVREMARWGLGPVARQRIGTLSEGYQRRVLLATSLLMSPVVWMVDRPFEALDAEGRVLVQTLLAGVLSGTTALVWPKLAVLADADPEDLPAPIRMSPVSGSNLTIGRMER